MEYIEAYNEWINNSYFDNETKEELKSLRDDKEIKDRFYKNPATLQGKGWVIQWDKKSNFWISKLYIK